MAAHPGMSTTAPAMTGNRMVTARPSSAITEPVIRQILARMARSRRRRHAAVRLAQIGTAVVVVLAWQASMTALGNSFFPTPLMILQRLVEWFTVGTPYGPIWTQIGITVAEAAAGFTLGAVAGAVAGILLARSPFLSDVCAPFVKAANAVPRIVLGSLFVILFGLGMSSKIATVVVMVFFAVFSEAFSSVQEIETDLIQQAHLFGATNTQAMRHIVVPIARVRILAGLHHAFGLALIGALMGEYIGSEGGLGLLIHTAQAMFDVAGIFAGLILTTVIALLAKSIISAVERRLAR